jgi:hypothetical protein
MLGVAVDVPNSFMAAPLATYTDASRAKHILPAIKYWAFQHRYSEG